MNINKEHLEKYAGRIIFDYLNIERKIQISFTDNVLLFNKSQSENCIEIGRYSITMMLLFSCFSINKKLFQRILYYYYWACKSIVERKVGTCAFFLTKLREEICTNVNKMQWYARLIHLDLMLHFIIGHETYHILFAQDESLKRKAIVDIGDFMKDIYKNKKRSKNKIGEYLLDLSLENILEDDCFKEEIACDKNSILFLFKTKLNCNTNHDMQFYESIYQQLLDMVMMFQYNGIHSSDFINYMSKDNAKQFINTQFYGVFRLWVTANTIAETDKYNVNVYSCLERTKERYDSIYSKKMRIRLCEYGMANNNEKVQLTDGDIMNKYRHQMCLMSDLINNMLIGEEIFNTA